MGQGGTVCQDVPYEVAYFRGLKVVKYQHFHMVILKAKKMEEGEGLGLMLSLYNKHLGFCLEYYVTEH